jgi:chromatin remodeling complex protein RSC6
MPSATKGSTVAKTPAKEKKVVVKKEATPVSEPVVEPVVVPVTEGNVTKEGECDDVIGNLLEKVVALSSHVKSVQLSLKLLIKEFDKQKKIIDKVQKKKDKAKKTPSGFAKPCKISDELCSFIGVDKGTEMSRTEITRHINSYVKQHNLNNPENRREFFPDKKLKTILAVKEGEKVTYFILQRLIAHHFPPSAAKLAAAKAEEAKATGR